MERSEVLQQRLENWCAASVRALANTPSVHYRGNCLVVDNEYLPVQAPHLYLDFSTHESQKLRGVADAIALRLIHSDRSLHNKLSPKSTLERLIFELLEQLRCESLVPDNMPGMSANLRNRFLFWADVTETSEFTENNVGILLYTLAVVSWSRLTRQPIPEQIENTIEHTRWGLTEKIGSQLRKLTKTRHDQHAFSAAALEIIAAISQMVSDSQTQSDQSTSAALKQLIHTKRLTQQWLDTARIALQRNYGLTDGDEIKRPKNTYQYRIFSRAYDQEVQADKLVRAEQLKKLRQQLDKRVRRQNINTHRIARRLKQLIYHAKLSGWSFGEEEGLLDSSRLARIVTSPNDQRLFRKEQYKPTMDCVVSLVIDNSGSMTHHNETIAALVDVLAHALELAGIKTEILGFTTREWNGGRILKEWEAAGKPDNPGRLNSLCHIIYKSAETRWRRSRQAIAGMLKSDLFREGVDGEALQWAVKRIEQRPESKKIILMLSDGSPMDTATHMANDDRYLDQHLMQVALDIENRPDINLCAIGVGLDLSAYYQQSHSITLNEELTIKDLFKITELLTKAV